MGSGEAERPRLAFGCVRLGSVSGLGTWRRHVALVREAVDSGITLFDTADVYGSGMSERVLGAAIRGRRGSVEIATKAGYVFIERSRPRHLLLSGARPFVDFVQARRPAADGDERVSASYSTKSFSAEHLRSAVEGSLRRLDTDYVDVFQLHGPPSPTSDLISEVIPVVDDLVHAGKIRRFGIGAESTAVAAEWLDVPRVDVVQVPFGLLDPQASEEVFPLAVEHGREVWVRGVLGGGVLSASLRGDPSARHHPKRQLIAALTELADRAGVSLLQLAVD